MASVGYGEYTYGKSHYGSPVYHFGAATASQTSGFTAESSVKRFGSSTIAASSGFTSAGVVIKLGAGTSAQTSGFTSVIISSTLAHQPYQQFLVLQL